MKLFELESKVENWSRRIDKVEKEVKEFKEEIKRDKEEILDIVKRELKI